MRRDSVVSRNRGQPMSRIFICYRREDTLPYAGRLYDDLKDYFGEDQLFMDIGAIQSGVKFRQVIEDALLSADVLIALIGRQWLTVADANGRPRLDNSRDYIRFEI